MMSTAFEQALQKHMRNVAQSKALAKQMSAAQQAEMESLLVLTAQPEFAAWVLADMSKANQGGQQAPAASQGQ